jgi:uncharacterized SAM-binding protein YcdF (DUF218 family)
MPRGRIFYNRERTYRRRNLIIIGLVVVLPLLWLTGLFLFVGSLPEPRVNFDRQADAIVVLTGGDGRVRAGFDLLENKNAKQMFISGVYRGVEVNELIALARKAPKELACCVTLGYQADDTIGNAYETAEWMHARGYRAMILVTSNYHIERAVMEMRMRLPDEKIVAYPVKPSFTHEGHWLMDRKTAFLLLGEYNKYLLTLPRYLGFLLVRMVF